jgi:FMN-dependent NADH-azoreductase
MKLLHIDSSILGENSVSRQLTLSIVNKLKQDNPALITTYRDLAEQPLEHLSAAHLVGAENASDALKQDLENGAAALDEFLGADILVIGAPMYNFSVSSQLKAWIDRVAVAGKTFRYTEKGPEGLAGGKQVFIVSSRGGIYSEGSPQALVDHQEPFLRAVLNFMGITDINYIRAEGVAMGPDHRQKALDNAQQTILSTKAA